MTNQKHKLKRFPFGTLAFRRLWAYSKGKRRTMKTQIPVATRTRKGFSLKRCSANQHPKSDEDTAFKQTEKTVNPRPVSAAARKEFSLKRCSANQHHKSDDDTIFNQTQKKMNLRPVSPAKCVESSLKRCKANKHNKSGKDAAFSLSGKDMNDKLKMSRLPPAVICRLVDEECTRFRQRRKMNSSTFKKSLSLSYGICTYREILIKSVQEKGGELRLALSPTAVKLYKDGTPLAVVMSRVGIQHTFTSEINSVSVWVTLRVKYGRLSITKA